MIRKHKALPYALLAPAFILFTLFVIAPVFQAAVFSLYKWNGLGPLTDFRGADNFVNLLKNGVFKKALLHNLEIIAVSLAVELPLALAIALVIGRSEFKLAVLFRTFFFLPYVLSEIITGVLWQFIYHPQYGLIRSFFAFFFPRHSAPTLLGNPETVLGAIMVVIIWKYFGFHMSILIAGLQDIPRDVREAALIDGANELQTIGYVVLPLLRSTIVVSAYFSIIGSLQVFDVVWAMGKGDPVNSAETMVTYLYKFGIQRLNIGFGSAVAVTIFALCLLFSIVYNRLTAEREGN